MYRLRVIQGSKSDFVGYDDTILALVQSEQFGVISLTSTSLDYFKEGKLGLSPRSKIYAQRIRERLWAMQDYVTCPTPSEDMIYNYNGQEYKFICVTPEYPDMFVAYTLEGKHALTPRQRSLPVDAHIFREPEPTVVDVEVVEVKQITVEQSKLKTFIGWLYGKLS